MQQTDKDACAVVPEKGLDKGQRSHQRLTNAMQSLIHVDPVYTQCAAPQLKTANYLPSVIAVRRYA